MKIKLLNSTDRNGCARARIFVNDKKKISIGCLSECPEDALLERDLNFVYEIIPLMREAYNAAKNGEAFEFIELDDDER